ncbi:MFS transporter [Sutterella sp.]|uniref:MFS transporter n=1 Tax=Sutterella sp. TaxID=1981025 RepID=UPI0026E03B90|nr:MFS transporter [Sutterella sp.]MDO5531695.1 MFS transporter [Sutterella sp.]
MSACPPAGGVFRRFRTSVRLNAKTLTAWIVVVLSTLVFYDTLLFFRIIFDVWENREDTARVSADMVRLDVSAGLNFGKRLEHFQGLEKIVSEAIERSGYPIAILAPGGRTILGHEGIPENPFDEGEETERYPGEILHQDDYGETYFREINFRDGRLAGWIVVRIDSAEGDREIIADFVKGVIVQLFSLVLGALVLALVLMCFERESRLRELGSISARSRAVCIALFVTVMVINAAASVGIAAQGYREHSGHGARILGQTLSDTAAVVATAGFSLDRADGVERFLGHFAGVGGSSAALEIFMPDGTRLAGSVPADEPRIGRPIDFPLATPLEDLYEEVKGALVLRVTLLEAPFLSYLRHIALDFATVTILGFVFLIELFHFLSRLSVWRAEGGREQGFTLNTVMMLRTLCFAGVGASQLSIAFIPTLMQRLLPDDTPSKGFFLSMAVSATMAGGALGVLVAGGLLKRLGARSVMTAGFLCAAAGAASAAVFLNPVGVTISRAVSGFGWGLCLLTLKTCAAKRTRILDVEGGVVAGTLCGGAFGSLIAQRFGFEAAFILETVLMLGLAVVPTLLFTGRERFLEEAGRFPALGFTRVMKSLADFRVAVHAFLVVLPYQGVCYGYYSFIVPLVVKASGGELGDTGRLILMRSLVIIFVGGSLLRLIPGRILPVVTGALLILLGTLMPTLMPSAAGYSLSVILIGVASCASGVVGILLGFGVQNTLGMGTTMSLFELECRAGRVVGPLAMGALLAFLPATTVAAVAGCYYLASVLVFIAIMYPHLTERKA